MFCDNTPECQAYELRPIGSPCVLLTVSARDAYDEAVSAPKNFAP